MNQQIQQIKADHNMLELTMLLIVERRLSARSHWCVGLMVWCAYRMELVLLSLCSASHFHPYFVLAAVLRACVQIVHGTLSISWT
jgi:hypothetical protein